MIAMKRSCLDRDEIELVLSGQLSADEFDSAIAHLDDCDSCRTAAESFQQYGGWMISSLSGDTDPLQAETACQIALWEVLESPQLSGAGQTPAGSIPQEMLGPYRLIRPLGSGGMAAVYLAEHIRLKRMCAIKILPRDRVDQPGWLDRFDREMTTVASLEHPNVVRASDAGHEDGLHYLVMEHLDGLDVGRVASQMGQLDIGDACEIVRQAALGLAHVHASGLVHRDVKPSNLMLTRDGGIKLLDLGLVLSGDDPLSVDDRLTTVGHLMGTMPYMAPEQLIDSRDVDSRADIYALGATLYRLIAGKPPHHGHGGLANQVMAITNQDPPRLDSVREDVDKELVKLVSAMLSRDPAARPATANEVAEQISEIGRGGQLKRLLRQAMRRPSQQTPVPSTLYPALETSGSDHQRRSWISFVAAGMLVALIAVAGFSFKIATDFGDLIINSEREGVIVSVSQGDEVVERLQIKLGPDNRVTLRKGTYTIEIDGAEGGLTLSKNVVTIGRGDETEVDLTSPALASRLYQGKDLAAWMNELTREQDPKTLGESMRAVEVMTRDQPAQRTQAAHATLRTARLWGEFSSTAPAQEANGASASPSQIYMWHLTDVLPKYEVDGLNAIDTELDQGNVKSRTAAIWLTPYFGDISSAAPEGFVDHLEKAVVSLRESGVTYDRPLDLGAELAIAALLQQDRPVAGHQWLEDHVRKEVSHAEQQWANPVANKGSFGGMGRAPWILDEDILAAALELETQDKMDLDWKWAAEVIANSQYYRKSDRTDKVFDATATHASDTIYKLIHSRLQNLFPTGHGGMGGMGYGTTGGFYAGRHWVPTFALGMKDSIWPKALVFYTENSRDADDSLKLLQKLRESMVDGGADPDHTDQPFQWIDAAIEKLQIAAAASNVSRR